MNGKLRQSWRKAFDRWLTRRVPPAHQIRLDQRCIFILPTRFGWLYLLFTLLIFLVGANYSNSLAFALSFLLLSLFLLAIVETFRNLSGLRLSAQHAGEGHVGEDIAFEIQLSGRDHSALQLAWPDAPTVHVNLKPQEAKKIRLFCPAHHRGYLTPGRFRIASQFPLGLLESWSWIDLDFKALVYPKPVNTPLPAIGWIGNEGRGAEVAGLDDFSGLKRYQIGDSISQIAWKKQAKGGQLLTKQFSSREDSRFWLRWEHASGGVEHRLGQLCYWVLEAEHQQQAYGLEIPGFSLPPGLGGGQRSRSMKALALFSAVGRVSPSGGADAGE